MPTTLRQLLESQPIETSAPFRLDMGGTLDLATFYYPLRALNPCTVNLALNLRTTVRLLPYRKGQIKISSTGFRPAIFAAGQAPFRHPMGLMYAVATHFQADGVHVVIESQSPPRSALGGSSVAAVALVAAFSEAAAKLGAGQRMQRNKIALLAHALEESVASVPCGRQDQLAAAFGGVHLWQWLACTQWPGFRRRRLVNKKDRRRLERQLLLAYGGVPHESEDVNGQWVRQFLRGEHRKVWIDIVKCTRNFAEALFSQKIRQAAEYMNRETHLRRRMTPAVIDDLGGRLIETAVARDCGARFTGAGGGGCIWALGLEDDIGALRAAWTDVLSGRSGARLLDARLDFQGLIRPC